MPRGGSERIVRRGGNARTTLACLESARDLDALTVLARALELAQLHAVPEEEAPFLAFVRGPLAAAAREAIGEQARELLAPLDTERRERAALAPSGVVLLASADAERSRRIRERLASITVHEAADLGRLLALVEESFDARMLLVIDGELPGVEGPLLLTLTRLLPPTASVLFRGDPPSGLYAVSLAWGTLPEQASEEEVAERCLAELGAAPSPRAIAERPMLVLVEPTRTVRALMTHRFEHEGYLVIACEDPLGALEACIDHEPDVLIAPSEMDGLDGGALARLVRGRLGEAAPSVVLRGAADPHDAGAASVVPIDARFADLLAEVRRLAPARRL
ncbi:MAG: response regulator [Sandaracinaceae bacterium]|nr:response regulator [Sandaracinaceae bacterium]